MKAIIAKAKVKDGQEAEFEEAEPRFFACMAGRPEITVLDILGD